MAMGRRRHRVRPDVGRPLSHHRRVPVSGVTGATRRRHMLGDRTEHPEPSETMPMPGASVRTRGSRGTLAPPLHWGRVAMDAVALGSWPSVPLPSAAIDWRLCFTLRNRRTARPCPIGCGRKSADKALRASQIFMVVKPFQSLRLQHDKVRNEFDAYCLVQHQVPRL